MNIRYYLSAILFLVTLQITCMEENKEINEDICDIEINSEDEDSENEEIDPSLGAMPHELKVMISCSLISSPFNNLISLIRTFYSLKSTNGTFRELLTNEKALTKHVVSKIEKFIKLNKSNSEEIFRNLCKSTDLNFVKVFINAGIDVKTRDPKTGFSAIEYAAAAGSKNIVDLLISSIDNNKTYIWEAILEASKNGHMEIVLKLIPQFNSISNGLQRRLVFAVLLLEYKLILILIEKCNKLKGNNLDEMFTGPFSPLSVACYISSKPLVKLLNKGRTLESINEGLIASSIKGNMNIAS